MSGHRRAAGKPTAPVLHVRRRSKHALDRVHAAPLEQRPAAALDAVRREWAAMDPDEAARRRVVLADLLLAEARAAAEINEKNVRCAA